MISKENLKLKDKCYAINPIGQGELVEVFDLTNDFCEVVGEDGEVFSVKYSDLFKTEEEIEVELSFRETQARMDSWVQDENKPKNVNNDRTTDDDLILSRDNDIEAPVFDDEGSFGDDGEPLFNFGDEEFPEADFDASFDDEEVDPKDAKDKKEEKKGKKKNDKKRSLFGEEVAEEVGDVTEETQTKPDGSVQKDEYSQIDFSELDNVVQDPVVKPVAQLTEDPVIEPELTQEIRVPNISDEAIEEQYEALDMTGIDELIKAEEKLDLGVDATPVIQDEDVVLDPTSTPVTQQSEPQIVPIVEEQEIETFAPVKKEEEVSDYQDGFVLGEDGRIKSANYEANAEEAHAIDQEAAEIHRLYEEVEASLAKSIQEGSSFEGVETLAAGVPTQLEEQYREAVQQTQFTQQEAEDQVQEPAPQVQHEENHFTDDISTTGHKTYGTLGHDDHEHVVPETPIVPVEESFVTEKPLTQEEASTQPIVTPVTESTHQQGSDVQIPEIKPEQYQETLDNKTNGFVKQEYDGQEGAGSQHEQLNVDKTQHTQEQIVSSQPLVDKVHEETVVEPNATPTQQSQVHHTEPNIVEPETLKTVTHQKQEEVVSEQSYKQDKQQEYTQQGQGDAQNLYNDPGYDKVQKQPKPDVVEDYPISKPAGGSNIEEAATVLNGGRGEVFATGGSEAIQAATVIAAEKVAETVVGEVGKQSIKQEQQAENHSHSGGHEQQGYGNQQPEQHVEHHNSYSANTGNHQEENHFHDNNRDHRHSNNGNVGGDNLNPPNNPPGGGNGSNPPNICPKCGMPINQCICNKGGSGGGDRVCPKCGRPIASCVCDKNNGGGSGGIGGSGGPGSGGTTGPDDKNKNNNDNKRIFNSTDEWSGSEEDPRHQGPRDYEQSKRGDVNMPKIKSDGVSQGISKAGDSLGGKAWSAVKHQIDGEVEKDKSTNKAREMYHDFISISSALGAAGALDKHLVDLEIFNKNIENATHLMEKGKLTRADLQANNTEAFKTALKDAGYSGTDYLRMVSGREEIVGFFEMRDAIIGDLRNQAVKLGANLPKNASPEDIAAFFEDRISKFESLAGIDVHNASTKTGILEGAKNKVMREENLQSVIEKARQAEKAGLGDKFKDAQAKKDALDKIDAKYDAQLRDIGKWEQAKNLSKIDPKNYDQMAGAYLSLSNNEKIRALNDRVDSSGRVVTDATYKGMTAKERAKYNRDHKVTRRMDKMTNDQLKKLLKEAKKDPSFSFADRTALRRELAKRKRNKAKGRAPSLRGLRKTLVNRMASMVDEASGANGMGTIMQTASYVLSAKGLVEKVGSHLSAKAAALGKKIAKPVQKFGNFVVRIESKRYYAHVERSDKMKAHEAKRQENLKNKRDKKKQKADKKQTNAAKKADRKATRKKKFDDSKVGKKVSKTKERLSKARDTVKNSKVVRGAGAAKRVASKVGGKVGSVLAAPFKAINFVKTWALKIAGIFLGVFLCIYLLTYLLFVFYNTSSRVIDGVIEAVAGAVNSVIDWFTGTDSRAPYDILSQLYTDLKEYEKDIATTMKDMASGTPQDPYVLDGHTISHYSHVRYYFVDEAGNQIGYSEGPTKKSAITLAYMMGGYNEFYTMDREAKWKLVKDLYDYMGADYIIDETPHREQNMTSGNIYLCDKLPRGYVLDGDCNDKFVYSCCGDDYYDDRAELQRKIDLGVGVYKNGGHTEQSRASDVMIYNRYGCYTTFTAKCTGHIKTERDFDPNSQTNYVVGYVYHNDGEEWTMTVSGDEMEYAAQYGGVPHNTQGWYNVVDSEGNVVLDENGDPYRVWDSYGMCGDYAYKMIEEENFCYGHSVPVCYGHKDVTIKVVKHGYQKVINDNYIPDCNDFLNNYDKYLKEFVWNDDTKEQTKNYMENDWFELYGITD